MAGISALTDIGGFIKITAVDQRDSLAKMISQEEMSPFKKVVAESLAEFSTGVLVDPEFGADAIQATKNMQKSVLLSREGLGYTETPRGRASNLNATFTSQKLKEMGADAIKLLIYYNSSATNASEQSQLVQQVYQESQQVDLPLVLKIITYAIPETYYHKGDSMIRAIQDIGEFCDVLALEYPLEENDENLEDAIPYMSQINSFGKPWVLLSRGMDFERYHSILKIAKDEGCRGYAVGRAVWKEAAAQPSWEQKVEFIRTVSTQRMKQLSGLYS